MLTAGWKRLALVACLAASPAERVLAAGNADIVDDAAVVAPGTCSVDSWVSNALPGVFTFIQPACTLVALPRVEFGAFIVHGWDTLDDVAYGPSLKINLRDDEASTSVALAPQALWNQRTGTVDGGSLFALVTLAVTRQVDLNLNAGWSYLRLADTPHAAFYGAQLEATVTDELKLMIEGFGRLPGLAGAQVGVRWTPHAGNIDYDLKVGNNAGIPSPCMVTLGVTVRW